MLTFLLNQLVEIEDFPVDGPTRHLLLEMYLKDWIPIALWLLQLNFGFLFTEAMLWEEIAKLIVKSDFASVNK